MRSLRAAVGGMAAALVLLAGCGDDPDPGDPSSTWTPTGTPESPTSAATQAPVEPALPQAATKATEAGARAFVVYYFDVVSYAQETGDVNALKAASSSRCDGCIAGIAAVEEHYRSGGKISGGGFTTRIDRVSKLSTSSASLTGFHVLATTTHSEQQVTSSDGTEETRKAGTDRWDLYVLWTAQARWRLDVMDVK